MIKSPASRRWALLLAGGLLISGAIGGLLTCPAIQRRVFPVAKFAVTTDLRLRDSLLDTLPPLPPDDDLIFLGIDESSLTIGEDDPEVIAKSRALTLMSAPFPWSREVWALAAERVLDAGARVVILDLLLDSPRAGDPALRAVLEKYPGRIVLAANLAPPANSQGLTAGLGRYLPPAASLLPDEAAEARTPVGFVNFWPDIDGQVRRVSFLETVEAVAGLPEHPASPVYPSLAAATLHALGEKHPVLSRRGSFLMKPSAQGAAAHAPKPLYEIFWPSLWERNYQNGGLFRDKVVMIGPAAMQFQDQHSTPAGTLLGPQLHLGAITAVRQSALFQNASPRADAALILAIGLLTVFGVGLLRRPALAVVGILAIGALFLLVARQVLQSGTSVGLAGPLASLILAGGFVIFHDYSQIFRERLLLRRALERRVSPEVLTEILQNPAGYLNQLGGVRKTVTILFSDLRGFTGMSERATPEDMVAGLNAYFDQMVRQIQGARGMVDKFIGDAVMAVWGSVPSLPPSEGVTQAVRAAMGMQAALAAMNAERRRQNSAPWSMGIGLHCGEAITGNIGSEQRLELTVIGDTVNLASRIEGVTKRYGVPIIISDAVAAHLAGESGWRIRPLDRVRVVGRRTAVTLYQPLAAPGEKEQSASASPDLAAADWDTPFAAYQAGDFATAEKAYAALADQFPEDRPAHILRGRCRDFQQASPPPAGWDGAIELDAK